MQLARLRSQLGKLDHKAVVAGQIAWYFVAFVYT